MGKKKEKSSTDNSQQVGHSEQQPLTIERGDPFAGRKPFTGPLGGIKPPKVDYENYDPLKDKTMWQLVVDNLYWPNSSFCAFIQGSVTDQISKFIPLGELKILCRTYRFIKRISEGKINGHNDWLHKGLKGKSNPLQKELKLICGSIDSLCKKKHLRNSVADSIKAQLLEETYFRSPAAFSAIMYELNPLTGTIGRPKEIASNFLIFCLVNLYEKGEKRNYDIIFNFLKEQKISTSEAINSAETVRKRYERISKLELKEDYNNIRSAFMVPFFLRNHQINMTDQVKQYLEDTLIPPLSRFIPE